MEVLTLPIPPLVIVIYVMCCEALHKISTSKTSVELETLIKSWVRPRLIGSTLLKYTAIYFYEELLFSSNVYLKGIKTHLQQSGIKKISRG